jgi:hypothetical protein
MIGAALPFDQIRSSTRVHTTPSCAKLGVRPPPDRRGIDEKKCSIIDLCNLKDLSNGRWTKDFARPRQDVILLYRRQLKFRDGVLI